MRRADCNGGLKTQILLGCGDRGSGGASEIRDRRTCFGCAFVDSVAPGEKLRASPPALDLQDFE